MGVTFNPDNIPRFEVATSETLKCTPKDHVISAIQASLQYCFWYKDANQRPFSSEQVDKLVQNVCDKFTLDGLKCALPLIKSDIMKSGITLLEDRMRSLDEVFTLDFKRYARTSNSPEHALLTLLTLPSFKADPLHKKALLAVKTSNAKFGLTSNLDVPADYRLPQVLVHLGVLEYSKELQHLIDSDTVIPHGTKYEVQIREATIDACREIAKINNCTPHEVDEYLITQKSKCENKHHLTICTYY